jgi:hypothetical protein
MAKVKSHNIWILVAFLILISFVGLFISSRREYFDTGASLNANSMIRANIVNVDTLDNKENQCNECMLQRRPRNGLRLICKCNGPRGGRQFVDFPSGSSLNAYACKENNKYKLYNVDRCPVSNTPVASLPVSSSILSYRNKDFVLPSTTENNVMISQNQAVSVSLGQSAEDNTIRVFEEKMRSAVSNNSIVDWNKKNCSNGWNFSYMMGISKNRDILLSKEIGPFVDGNSQFPTIKSIINSTPVNKNKVWFFRKRQDETRWTDVSDRIRDNMGRMGTQYNFSDYVASDRCM